MKILKLVEPSNEKMLPDIIEALLVEFDDMLNVELWSVKRNMTKTERNRVSAMLMTDTPLPSFLYNAIDVVGSVDFNNSKDLHITNNWFGGDYSEEYERVVRVSPMRLRVVCKRHWEEVILQHFFDKVRILIIEKYLSRNTAHFTEELNAKYSDELKKLNLNTSNLSKLFFKLEEMISEAVVKHLENKSNLKRGDIELFIGCIHMAHIPANRFIYDDEYLSTIYDIYRVMSGIYDKRLENTDSDDKEYGDE